MLNRPSHIPCVILSCALLAACGDDEPKKQPPIDMASDMGADMAAVPDLDASADLADAPPEDMPEDMSEDMPEDMSDLAGDDMPPDMPGADLDPCAGVDCGPNGRCMAMGAAPACACDAGFVAQGLSCAPQPNAPSLDNLPAQQASAAGAPGSFQLEASDPDGDALGFTLDADACPFAVTVDGAGLIAWTCPAQDAACDAVVSITDPGGLMDQDTLSITCAGVPPVITSTPPADAAEGELFRYTIVCADPDGEPTTLTVAADDTCGGALSGATYTLRPDEQRGGTSCLMSVTCSDSGASVTQQAMIAIAERNAAPVINSLNSATARWGRAGSRQLNVVDTDQPAQPLTYAIASADCSFPVQVSATGLVEFTCAAAVETCTAQAVVSDGMASGQQTLTIRCTNNAPYYVGPTGTAAREEQLFEYAITCADQDNDPVAVTLGTNTCNATLRAAQSVTIASFTPTEQQGGTTCDLELICDDTLARTTRDVTITIAETNQRPTLAGPASSQAHVGQQGSVQFSAADADLPAQALTFSLSAHSCPFPVAITQAGVLTHDCGASVQSCGLAVRLTDGQATEAKSVTLQCTNTAPAVTNVHITPDPIPAPGAPLTCAYTFADPDGDADQSSVAWLVNGAQVGQGQGFTAYQADDLITCRVTPHDGTATTAPITSAPLRAPL